MGYDWITGIVVLVSVIFLVSGVITLFRKDWFLNWLRGTLGMFFVLFSVFFGLLAVNVFSYQQMKNEQSVATLSFERVDKQLYDVTVSQPSGREMRYEVRGDLWQIDARVIKWEGVLSAIGFTTGYKLDRLQGRFITLEQERSTKRTVYALSEPDVGFDLWSAIKSSSGWLPIVDAAYGSATFLPMADGAIFSVSIGNAGLVARPLNDRADLALEEWE
ncbi:hypothetical protein A9Q99_26605 [Gammaproteobacteria bacterium 45_16_T64]|nr:hypothetical protein A9Q99_26605 [Gammaproteobacteria bacterium 45_16_T64]